MNDADPVTSETPAIGATHGWYPNPDGRGLRFWDGEKWSREFLPEPGPTRKEFLWGLALGFGMTGGVVGFLSIPIAAFYFPLGFGAAGVVLSIAALAERRGDPPWFAFVAVIASVAALGLGISACGEFTDASDRAQNALERFSP